MVDFLGDGLKISRKGLQRVFLTGLTFFPPFLFAWLDPSIFDKALGIAGGLGEAFLNGILPITLVWIGRYAKGLPGHLFLPGGRFSLSLLLLVSLFVICLETFLLLR